MDGKILTRVDLLKWFAPLAAYGEEEGLTPREVRAYEKFTEGMMFADCKHEAGFATCEATEIRGDVVSFLFWADPDPRLTPEEVEEENRAVLSEWNGEGEEEEEEDEHRGETPGQPDGSPGGGGRAPADEPGPHHG